MLKKTSVLLFFLFITCSAFSQIGIRLGYNYSTSGNLRHDAKPGFYLGGSYEYNLKNNFALEPRLSFIMEGTKYETSTYDIYAVEIPVLLSYKIHLNTTQNFKFKVGPYISNGLTIASHADNGKTFTGWNDVFNRTLFGLQAEVSYNLNNKVGIQLGFKHSLKKQFRSFEESLYQKYTKSFSLGLAYNF